MSEAIRTAPAIPKHPDKGLNRNQLAERLGILPTTLSNCKKRPDWQTWCKDKDPDGTVWEFDPIDLKYYPEK